MDRKAVEGVKGWVDSSTALVSPHVQSTPIKNRKATIALILGSVVLILALLVAPQVISILQRQTTQTFKGSGVELTYPGDWHLVDTAKASYCKAFLSSCVMGIQLSDGTVILIYKTFFLPAITFDVADNISWSSFQAGLSSALPGKINLVSQDSITIDGQIASRRVFDVVPQTGSRVEPSSDLLVYTIKDFSSYTIATYTFSADAFSAHRADVDSIISSIHFTS